MPAPVHALALDADAQDEAERLTLERRLRARSDRDHGRRDGRLPVISATRQRRSAAPPSGTILVYRLGIEEAGGVRIHDEAGAIHLSDRVDSLQADARIEHVLDRSMRDLKTRITLLDARARAAIAERDDAVDSIRMSAARLLVQQDLFDCRIGRRPQTSDAPLLTTNASALPSPLQTTTTLLAVLHVRP